MSWSRAFDNPIHPPKGKPIVTLKDAAGYIQRLPQAEQRRDHWQNAVEALLLVVELNGPTMLARIGMMRALNAGRPEMPIARRRTRAKAYRIIR